MELRAVCIRFECLVCVAVCLTMNVTHSGNGSQWSHARYIKSAGSHFETPVHGSSRYRAVTSLFVHTGQANMSRIMLHLLHEQQQDENRGGEMWRQAARQMLQQKRKQKDRWERGREKDGVWGLERQQELYHMARSNLSLWHHGWWEGRPHHPIVSSYFIMGFVSVNCNNRKTRQARWTRQVAHFSLLVLPPIYNVFSWFALWFGKRKHASIWRGEVYVSSVCSKNALLLY